MGLGRGGSYGDPEVQYFFSPPNSFLSAPCILYFSAPMFSLSEPILFSWHLFIFSWHPIFSLFLGGAGGGKRKVCTSGPPYIVQARSGREHRGVKECRRVPAAPPATLLTTSRASEVPDQKMCLLCLPVTPPGISSSFRLLILCFGFYFFYPFFLVTSSVTS